MVENYENYSHYVKGYGNGYDKGKSEGIKAVYAVVETVQGITESVKVFADKKKAKAFQTLSKRELKGIYSPDEYDVILWNLSIE